MFKSNRQLSRNAALSLVFALVLSFFSPSLGSWNTAEPARASSSVNFAGSYLNFDLATMQVLNGDSISADVNDVFLYPSAGVIQGVSVDVSVEIVSKSGPVNLWDWDESQTSQFNGQNPNQLIKDVINLYFDDGTVTFRFKFWETGSVTYASGISGVPV